jgi:Resolvase, N terminal domain
MLEQLRPGDIVVVWRLDRLGRSRRNLISLVEELTAKGMAFRSLSEAVDTTTANRKLVFSIMGARPLGVDVEATGPVSGLVRARPTLPCKYHLVTAGRTRKPGVPRGKNE